MGDLAWLGVFALQHSHDLSELGKKVLDTAQFALGPWVESKATRKKADAKAHEIVTIAKATASARRIEQRTAQRLAVQEIRHQQNIEAILLGAINETGSVSSKPVDPDWVNRFFRSCEDVSDSKMQAIFSKLFAGEVAEPGTFSRRAISVVQDMSTREAKLFEKVCSVFWFLESPHGCFIPSEVVNFSPNLLNSDESIELGDIGILNTSPLLSVILPPEAILRYGPHRFSAIGPSLGIPAYTVTTAAQELQRLFTKAAHLEYLEKSLAYFRSPRVGMQLQAK